MAQPDKNKEFWGAQSSSLQRYGTDDFYKKKAAEHISIISPFHLGLRTIDLGCGAGELLSWFLIIRDDDNNIAALDYSESMLSAARKKIGSPTVDFVCEDPFKYLPGSEFGLWMTTQAINQYLSAPQLVAFIKMFRDNHNAKALYLFDCIDPVRYGVLSFGCRYDGGSSPPEKTGLGGLSRSTLGSVKRVLKFLRMTLNRQPYRSLDDVGMGFGFLPSFWLMSCKTIGGLHAEIISSRYYEYRYHVIVTKT